MEPRRAAEVGSGSGPGAGRDVSLPVLGARGAGNAKRPGVRRSRNGPRRAIVLGLVHIAIAAHIAHWLVTGSTVSPVEPSESMSTLETGAVNAGFIFFAVAIVTTLIFGRFFCGWGCHIVALQDLCSWMLKKMGVRPRPFRSRLLVFVPLIFAIYMFVWPTLKRDALIPAAERWLPEAAAWLGPRAAFPGFHNDLIVSDFWATFPTIAVAIPFLLVCGFACVYFLGAKGFCTYGCPYGGFFAPVDTFSPGRILVDHDKCEGCGHCTAVCTSNVRVHEEIRDFGMVVDPGCMKCLDCVSVCPNDALRFGFGAPPILKSTDRGRPGAAARRAKAKKKPHDLSWTEEWALAAVFAGSFFAWRGVYAAVPMLMAIGVAGCVTYIVWTAWRMISRRNARLHNFQLRLNGRLKPAGGVFLLLAALTAALTAQSGFVRWAEKRADRLDAQVLAPPELVLAGGADEVPEAQRALAREAIAWYTRASSFSMGGWGLANRPENLFRIAWLRAVTGDYSGAETAMRRGLRGGAATEQAAVQLSNLMTAQGNLVGAEQEMRAWIEREGPGEASVSEVAKLMARQGRGAEAEAFVLGTLRQHPELHGLGAGMIRAMLGARQTTKAEALARELVELRPEDAGLRTQLGAVLMQIAPPGSEQFDEGVREVERAIEIDPRYAPGLQQRAIGLAMAGDMNGAERALREAMVVAGADLRAGLMLVELLRQTGRATEAENLLRELQKAEHAPAASDDRGRTPTGGVREP